MKFKTLWKSGYDAHLDIDSHAGQAWVGLRLRLGQAQELGHPFAKGKGSPCRQLCQARRAEGRTLKSDDHVNYVVENDSTEAEQAVVAKNLKETLKDEGKKLSSENALPNGQQIETEKLRIQKHLNI